MPIYEYICRDCGEKFEKLVIRRDDAAAPACPKCGREVTEQVYSTFAMAGPAASSCSPSGRFT